jgi:hypothetical protein
VKRYREEESAWNATAPHTAFHTEEGDQIMMIAGVGYHDRKKCERYEV